ncbi:MAG: N-acetyltransferase [Actinobacteria bacterium]|nr:N-acetyltransferase [Actinomycetota bacterium]
MSSWAACVCWCRSCAGSASHPVWCRSPTSSTVWPCRSPGPDHHLLRVGPEREVSVGSPAVTMLLGRRIVLRQLVVTDFPQWREVRRRNVDWLTKWEPSRPAGAPDVIEDRDAFGMRCSSRQREQQLGVGYGFGIFVDGSFCGEINLSSVQRGPFQCANVGYWIDEARAGNAYMSEAVVVLARHAFEHLALHRLEIAIIRTALRYLEINGVWEDHVRYAITAEDWEERASALLADWIHPR